MRVIKIGGNIVDDPNKLDRFLADFASLKGDKLLVHGGGKVATTISKALGIETRLIDGRRVTDADTLDVVTMVYAGLINKKIVGKLQALDCNALGLSGADGGLIVSKRRATAPVDYGFVGDPVPEQFGLDTARMLIDGDFTPVVAPITLSESGGLLNTNADTVAQTIALGLSEVYEVELIYCFEKQGVLMDVDDDSSVIPEITPAFFEELKSRGVVTDGMLPKLENAFRAIAGGVRSVVICSAEHIARPDYGGTTLKNQP
jgi:acetylglutamate kinase